MASTESGPATSPCGGRTTATLCGRESASGPDSRNTSYLDLSADVPIGETGLTVNLHYGKQTYHGSNPRYPTAAAPRSNSSVFSYSDWKAGVSYALPKDFTVGVFASGTHGADKVGYGSIAEGGSYPRNIAKTTGTVFIKKTF